jgi:hypothetical protein
VKKLVYFAHSVESIGVKGARPHLATLLNFPAIFWGKIPKTIRLTQSVAGARAPQRYCLKK